MTTTSTPARSCGLCAEPLPAGAPKHQRWCTPAHRKRALALTTTGPRCQDCAGALPVRRKGQPGPARAHCDECRSQRKRQRDRGRYVPKGYPVKRPGRRVHAPSDRFGALVLVAYVGRDSGGTRAEFLCDCGQTKTLRLGNVTSGATTDCADRAAHPDPRSKGRQIAYGTAHHRVTAQRGRAREHPCALCGDQAEHWAYAHGDHDQRADLAGKDAGRPFSPEPAHYLPACRPCHARWDNARRATGGGLSLAHVALRAVVGEAPAMVEAVEAA